MVLLWLWLAQRSAVWPVQKVFSQTFWIKLKQHRQFKVESSHEQLKVNEFLWIVFCSRRWFIVYIMDAKCVKTWNVVFGMFAVWCSTLWDCTRCVCVSMYLSLIVCTVAGHSRLPWYCIVHSSVSVSDVRGYRGGSSTAVQAWQPCPLWEPSLSHPILL